MNRAQMLRNAYNNHWGSLLPPTIYIDGPRSLCGRNRKNLVRYKIVFGSDHSIGDFDPLVAELTTLPHVEEVYAHRSKSSYGSHHYWSVIVWFRGRAKDVKPPKPVATVQDINADAPINIFGGILMQALEKATAVKNAEKVNQVELKKIQTRASFEKLSVIAQTLTYGDLNMLALLVGLQGDAEFIADTVDPINEMDWKLDKEGCIYANPERAADMMDDAVNAFEIRAVLKKLADAGISLDHYMRVRVKQTVEIEQGKV